VRAPQDVTPPPRHALTRRRRWIIAAIILIIVVIASLHTFAVFYTDSLWFSSIGLHSVWSSLFEIKIGLLLAFGAIFAAGLLASILVGEKLVPHGPALGAEDDFVRRYQETVGPHVRWIRAGVVVLLSVLLGSDALGQWQHWILFRNGTSFGVKDPIWHKDIGYFVFKLPFETFLVQWSFLALFLILIVTVIFHYLNGGIRIQGPKPRVSPAVKAHISLILGLLALVKAAGYFLQRYSLDNATDSVGQGAGYADIHARLPALELLILVSLAAFVLLIFNIRRQGWALPVLGVGMWFLVALSAGTIYPALVQAFKVSPNEEVLESPYIHDNIVATRAAYGLNKIKKVPYPVNDNLTANQINANATTLNNVQLWDPSVTSETYQKLQDISTYYQFGALSVDRYDINGQETPVIVGAREINESGLPSGGWVNTHLQYTHGYGMIVAPANQVTPSGDPVFSVGQVPPVSSSGLPQITQPSVYYGVGNMTYVVVNSKQAEVDYELPNNEGNVETHYSGTGGVQLGSLFNRLMFAVRFGDYNLAISSELTSKSRIMFVRNIQTRITKVAPYLSLSSDPYPVLIHGSIYWIQNAFTTTNSYPYSESVNTSELPSSAGLPSSFNYIRNSVDVVTNAYTGKMTFYVTDPNDPIIKTYERAFPGMFTPESKMGGALKAQLRYPKDLFAIQALMYGKYHITNVASFFNQADEWTLSPSPGSGSPTQALPTTTTLNARGQLVSTGQQVRMSPIYEEMKIPGQSNESFDLLDAMVPYSTNNQIQTLSGFMIAGSDPSNFGKLTMYVTPQGNPVDGPSLVSANIDSTPAVSQSISLLDKNGSSVELGNVVMLPIANSLIYVQPLYVQSSRNNVPELRQVIVVYGKEAALGKTLAAALTSAFSAPVSTTPVVGGSSGALSPQIKALLSDAQTEYQSAQSALSSGNLGTYQSDISAMESDLVQIQDLTGGSVPPVSAGSSSASSVGSNASSSSSSSTTSSSSSTGAVASGRSSSGSSGGSTATGDPARF